MSKEVEQLAIPLSDSSSIIFYERRLSKMDFNIPSVEEIEATSGKFNSDIEDSTKKTIELADLLANDEDIQAPAIMAVGIVTGMQIMYDRLSPTIRDLNISLNSIVKE